MPLSVELRLGRRYAINWSGMPFHIFSSGKESRKFHRQFNVELHGTDDDRELMARYNGVIKMTSHAIFQYNVLAIDDTHNT